MGNLGLRSLGIWYHFLSKPNFLSFFLEGIPTAQLYTVSTSSEGGDEGILVEVPAPKTAFVLSCS